VFAAFAPAASPATAIPAAEAGDVIESRLTAATAAASGNIERR
jgi:hypothetical protein